jgi:hypothetical protein
MWVESLLDFLWSLELEVKEKRANRQGKSEVNFHRCDPMPQFSVNYARKEPLK